jgi:hypothetical protein
MDTGRLSETRKKQERRKKKKKITRRTLTVVLILFPNIRSYFAKCFINTASTTDRAAYEAETKKKLLC